MLFLVGLGLGDAKDITVRGLEVVKSAKHVYLEAYTSILTVGKEALEDYYGREVVIADREMVEQNSDELFKDAVKEDVAFLVVGDPFGATTHTDLVLRAAEKNIPYKVIHNASIMNAVGCCGLQLYNFGETVSIVLWTDTWRPESFYDKIAENSKRGLHTLCLLDIKMKEQTVENMLRGRKVFEPPRFQSVSQAVGQLLEIIDKREFVEDIPAFTEDSIAVGIARVGSDSQHIAVGTMRQLAEYDMGPPLHALVIPGHMHCLEIDFLKQFVIDHSVLEKLNSQHS